MDAWSRYTPGLSATAQHPRSELESSEDGALVTSDVADNNSVETGHFELDVADVADRTHDIEENAHLSPDILEDPYSQHDQEMGLLVGNHTNSRTIASDKRS